MSSNMLKSAFLKGVAIFQVEGDHPQQHLLKF